MPPLSPQGRSKLSETHLLPDEMLGGHLHREHFKVYIKDYIYYIYSRFFYRILKELLKIIYIYIKQILV